MSELDALPDAGPRELADAFHRWGCRCDCSGCQGNPHLQGIERRDHWLHACELLDTWAEAALFLLEMDLSDPDHADAGRRRRAIARRPLGVPA